MFIKIISRELVLIFDQSKTFTENYKPIKAELRLVYKFNENNYRSRLFTEFIQIQNRYPTSFDKIIILNRRLKLLKNLFLAKCLISVAATLVITSYFTS